MKKNIRGYKTLEVLIKKRDDGEIETKDLLGIFRIEADKINKDLMTIYDQGYIEYCWEWINRLEEDLLLPMREPITGASKLQPILWNAAQADLARVYRVLFESGIITCSGREFSKHFLMKNGKPMPEDFAESLTSNQPQYSKRQGIVAVQKMTEQFNNPGN